MRHILRKCFGYKRVELLGNPHTGFVNAVTTHESTLRRLFSSRLLLFAGKRISCLPAFSGSDRWSEILRYCSALQESSHPPKTAKAAAYCCRRSFMATGCRSDIGRRIQGECPGQNRRCFYCAFCCSPAMRQCGSGSCGHIALKVRAAGDRHFSYRSCSNAFLVSGLPQLTPALSSRPCTETK